MERNKLPYRKKTNLKIREKWINALSTFQNTIQLVKNTLFFLMIMKGEGRY